MVNITQTGEGRTITMSGNVVNINGVEYKKPGFGNSMCTINDKVYINGFSFEYGKFKRSLVAMWHNWL